MPSQSQRTKITDYIPPSGVFVNCWFQQQVHAQTAAFMTYTMLPPFEVVPNPVFSTKSDVCSSLICTGSAATATTTTTTIYVISSNQLLQSS